MILTIFVKVNVEALMEPNRQDSIVSKYASLIKENREKRKLRGEWREDEPAELIFDPSCVGDTDLKGTPLPWEYSNLISALCVQDIFGDDWSCVSRLLDVHPAPDYIYRSEGGKEVLYFREQDILRVLNTLATLAKSNIINTLRPVYQYIKADEPVYSSTDLMNLLDMKEERLRKFRDKGYIGYTKYPGSDKIWYQKKDLEAFLNNPEARHEPWK